MKNSFLMTHPSGFLGERVKWKPFSATLVGGWVISPTLFKNLLKVLLDCSFVVMVNFYQTEPIKYSVSRI